MKKSLLFLLLLSVCCGLAAGTPLVKVDFDGRAEKIGFRDFKASNGLKSELAAWNKADGQVQDTYLINGGKAVGENWENFEISFVPTKSGHITMSLRGALNRDRNVFTYTAYRNFSADGMPLTNGNFAELNSNGIPANWKAVPGVWAKAVDGNYVCGTHDRGVTKRLEVTAGQPVTIRFQAKKGPEAADKGVPFKTAAVSPVKTVPKSKSVSAGTPLVKVDFDGRAEKIGFRDFKASNGLKSELAAWNKTDGQVQDTYLINGGKAVGENWENFEISFVPTKSGHIIMSLRGALNRDRNVFTYTAYRNFNATGTLIYQGNFALADHRGIPQSWGAVPGVWCKSPDGNYVCGTHDRGVTKRLEVTAGQPVTIRFQAKKGPEVADKGVPFPVASVKKNSGVRQASMGKPANYYWHYADQVALLPLSDKGISGDSVVLRDPARLPKRPCPEPVFSNTGKLDKPGSLTKKTVAVELLEESGTARNAAVRFGFPLPRGGVFSPEHLRVTDPSGKEVPAQFSVTGFWPDQSLKWVLIQFTAPLKANEKAVYLVEAGNQVRHTMTASPLKWMKKDADYVIETGRLSAVVRSDLSITAAGQGVLKPLQLKDENGKVFQNIPVKTEVEENGPETFVLKAEGKLGPQHSTVTRLRFHRDSGAVGYEVTLINTNMKQEFSDLTSLELPFVPADGVVSAEMNGQKGTHWFQSDERTLNGKTGTMGTLAVRTGNGNFNVTIRDAAFRWPKGMKAEKSQITLELLPEQPSAEFGKNLPHYLKFPFVEGKYRSKWGMAFTEKLRFDFSSAPAAANAETNLPVVAVVDRDWYFQTKTVEGVSAGSDHSFDQYDRKMAQAVDEHWKIKQLQREFGYFNYGDWYGERGHNWGNNEYDMAYGLFIHFARTGNRRAARLASAAAQHQADVDIVHAYPDPYFVGGNAEHAIGHTGTSYQRVRNFTWTYRYDQAYSAENGHTWSRGMVKEWQFNGNAEVFKSALLMGEQIVNYMAPNFNYLGTHERSAGWSLTAIMGIYDAVCDPVYLEAARRIASVPLREQNFRKGGAWPHRLPADHAGGHADTFGNVPFLMGTLLEGLSHYHRVTQDPAAAKSIVSGVKWLVSAWNDKACAWPYGASWDGKAYNDAAPGLNLLIAPGVIYAANLSGDRRMFEIASKIMNFTVFQGMDAAGKAISMDMANVAGLLDGLSLWNAAHPDSPYSYNVNQFVQSLFRTDTMDFRLRGPAVKNFIIQVKSDNPEMTLTRTRCGARPKASPVWNLKFRNASGKILAEDSAVIEKNYRKTFRLNARRGERIQLTVNDDMTAFWSIAPTASFDAFAEVGKDSNISVFGTRSFYFTVPAGTESFTFTVCGVHTGPFSGSILDENGVIRAKADGQVSTVARFPWLSGWQNAPSPVQKISVTCGKSAKPRLWRLIVIARRDISFHFDGIPSMVSITPALLTD